MILLDNPILKDPLSIIVSCINMKQILNFISISKYFYEIFTNESNPCVFLIIIIRLIKNYVYEIF